MNAPPPHHNYQYHPQYPGPGHHHPGAPQGHGGYWSSPAARFAAEGARARPPPGQAVPPSKDDKTSPFLSTVHSHPGFQPQKIGKGAGVVRVFIILS